MFTSFIWYVPLKCDVVLQVYEQLKKLANLNGVHLFFAPEYSSQIKWDEYSQAKQVLRLLISKLFNRSHSDIAFEWYHIFGRGSNNL